MMRMIVRFAWAAAAGLVVGCTASPLREQGLEIAELSPREALRAPDRTGATVVWGGRIVGIINRGEFTEIEVLSLPLGAGDRPRRSADGGARFVIRHPGFLDPMTFSTDRYVSVLGRFTGIEKRSVGAFPLDHPVVQSHKLELWPLTPNNGPANVHFGFRFGVGF